LGSSVDHELSGAAVGLYYDRLRTIELERASARPAPRPAAISRSREARAILLRRWHARPFQVVTVSSNKGGVGKTTLAANLAVYLRALREDLPILIFGLDDQSLLDRMFALTNVEPAETVASALRVGNLSTAIRSGQYGVHYVPSDPCIAALKDETPDILSLHDTLDRTGWRGLVIIDTKSDLEVLTRNAIAASDLTLVPICDDASLHEGEKVFDLLDQWGIPRERARVVLSMLDLRVRYPGAASVHELLRSQLDARGLSSFGSFLSNSPKVQSLGTNPEGHPLSILHGAPRSLVNRQMRGVAQEVLDLLGVALERPSHPTPSRPAPPPNTAKRYLLGRRAPWRQNEATDEAAVDRLIAEIHTARAS
jgi:cellulose biosynthesis protein BcsQ